ncbi:7TM diverse intracellular signaling domain-containing protein [Planctobacterium marinum]|uniref:histidine kinase n=1 Tax=Planctobacterium marinum TaxID=1631968 RepID=A0AA48HPN0_9ALTE|nr:hypothetical protein MACH26_12050 [Planctobacterium marinum]
MFLIVSLYSFSSLASVEQLPNHSSFRIDLSQSAQFTFTNLETTLQQISGATNLDWQSMRGKGASFGYKPGRALWLRFNVVTEKNSDAFLLFDYAILDNIAVYSFSNQNDTVQAHYSGDHLPPAEREVQHRKLVVPVHLSAGTNPFYVRIQTGSSYTVPLVLIDKDSFYQSEAVKNMLLSGLAGGALFMVLLNLFGGLRLQHSGYLYYAAFAASFTLFNLTLNGYFRFYILPIWPNVNDLLSVLFGQLGGLTYALFLTVFLPLKKRYPVDYKICQAHAILCGFLACLSVVGLYNQIQIFTHLANAIFALYSMILAIRTWRGGERTAIYLVLGWVFLMASVIAKAMVALGLLPYSDMLFHSFDLGITVNFALIAFGLASRIVDIQEREKVAREEADSAKNLAVLNMEHYRALFEYAPIPMFKVNKMDHFIEANKAFLTLFGFACERDLVQSKVESKSVYCSNKDYLSLVSDLRHHGVADAETQIRTLDGKERWVRISVRVVADDDEIIYEGACIDVTAQVEQQAFEIAAHKREVNQLEALVAGVAHYLNTPLGTANTAQTLVTGKTDEVEQQLSEQKLTAARLRSFLDVVQQSGKVIKSSLDKSINVVERFKELNPEEQQVTFQKIRSSELLKGLKTSLPAELKDELSIVLDDTSEQVHSLPVHPLLKVLKKLAVNAWHHGEANEVYIALNKQIEGYELVVKDNGKGLSEEVNVQDLFAPFYAKTLSLQEVSGLDLFVVKTIVQNRLNGRVEIDELALPALHFHIWIPSLD